MSDKAKCDICKEEVTKYKLTRHTERVHPEIEVLERAKIILRHKQEGKTHRAVEFIQCPFVKENVLRCQSFVLKVG